MFLIGLGVNLPIYMGYFFFPLLLLMLQSSFRLFLLGLTIPFLSSLWMLFNVGRVLRLSFRFEFINSWFLFFFFRLFFGFLVSNASLFIHLLRSVLRAIWHFVRVRSEYHVGILYLATYVPSSLVSLFVRVTLYLIATSGNRFMFVRGLVGANVWFYRRVGRLLLVCSGFAQLFQVQLALQRRGIGATRCLFHVILYSRIS